MSKKYGVSDRINSDDFAKWGTVSAGAGSPRGMAEQNNEKKRRSVR